MGREASEMSVSPLQNFWNPPPVPELPTVTRAPARSFWNSSATASVMGKTVLDPSTLTTDVAVVSEAGPPPQAARVRRIGTHRA
jgi:hypothetical protein